MKQRFPAYINCLKKKSQGRKEKIKAAPGMAFYAFCD